MMLFAAPRDSLPRQTPSMLSAPRFADDRSFRACRRLTAWFFGNRSIAPPQYYFCTPGPAIHSGISLLRGLDRGSGGARNPHGLSLAVRFLQSVSPALRPAGCDFYRHIFYRHIIERKDTGHFGLWFARPCSRKWRGLGLCAASGELNRPARRATAIAG